MDITLTKDYSVHKKGKTFLNMNYSMGKSFIRQGIAREATLEEVALASGVKLKTAKKATPKAEPKKEEKPKAQTTRKKKSQAKK